MTRGSHFTLPSLHKPRATISGPCNPPAVVLIFPFFPFFIFSSLFHSSFELGITCRFFSVFVFHKECTPSALTEVVVPKFRAHVEMQFGKANICERMQRKHISGNITIALLLSVCIYWRIGQFGNWLQLAIGECTHWQTWLERKYEIMEVNGRHIRRWTKEQDPFAILYAALFYSIFDIQITHTLTLMYLCNRKEGCWC